MVIFGCSLVLLLIYLLYKSKRALQMLQQNYYDESHRYLLWLAKNFKKVFLNLDIICLLFIIFFYIDVEVQYIIGIFSLLYIILWYIYYHQEKKITTKIPLKFTARIKRLYLTEIILYLIISVVMILNYVPALVPLYYLMLGLLVYFDYLVVLIINYLNWPVEKLVYWHYKKEATKKLAMMKIPVIGITGSYGKTSCKNIINDILSVKYNPFATPKNFNTTYGLINSINNYLDRYSDLFIAEMGAFKVGEIKKTCDLMHPKYGILTTIGEAHLESFGSRKNIQKGKFELIESLPNDGLGILNGDDKWQTDYDLKNKKCHLLWIGIDNPNVDARALNIKLSSSGMTFDVSFKGDDKLYPFQSRLLGRHNVYNLLTGILLGHELGMSYEELRRGVAMIHQIEHRLELKKVVGLNIIDDAYNSNPVGSKRALEVLSMMPGTKVVVTPGMVELGSKQYQYNKNFGTQIAEVSDYVILVGKEQTKPIKDGLLEKKYREDNIYIINDVKDAFKILKRIDDGNVYVLLENDLPDLFNE